MTRAVPRPTDAERNVGHGHVHPRPDGRVARCGGPGVCRECSAEAVQKAGEDWDRFNAAAEGLAALDTARLLLDQEDPPLTKAALRVLLDRALAGIRPALVVEEPPAPEPVASLYGFDERVHSRACGIQPHGHGSFCHRDCPTCGGRADFEAAPVNSAAKEDGVAR